MFGVGKYVAGNDPVFVFVDAGREPFSEGNRKQNVEGFVIRAFCRIVRAPIFSAFPM